MRTLSNLLSSLELNLPYPGNPQKIYRRKFQRIWKSYLKNFSAKDNKKSK